MARDGLSWVTLSDFSGGMYRNASLDRLPGNASAELLNSLLDLQGGIFRRGGSAYRSNAAFGSSLRWIWDGYLASGHVTLVASPTAYGRLEGSGAVTNLGEGGVTAPPRVAVYEGKMFFPGGKTYDGTSWSTAASVGTSVAIAANRLLVASGSRVSFSKVADPSTFAETDFHEIPGGVEILALEGARDSCVVFTTAGVWVISGLADELTDAEGNVQHRLDRYSGDIVLWGGAGIASWQGALIVPGADAVWLMRRGVTSEQLATNFQRLSDPIRDLYGEYVRLGYQPGRAVVFNNHYLLPIIGNGKVVDVLVCRLDLEPKRGQAAGAWTHMMGTAAGLSALAVRVSASASREPELLAALYSTTARALTLSWLNPTDATKTDADGVAPEWVWQTPAVATGGGIRNLVSRIRLRYQLFAEGGSPTIAAYVGAELPTKGSLVWGAFSWGSGSWATPGGSTNEPLRDGMRLTAGGEAPPDITASIPVLWRVRRKRRAASFRFVCKAPSAQLAVKTLEIAVRPYGRR